MTLKCVTFNLKTKKKKSEKNPNQNPCIFLELLWNTTKKFSQLISEFAQINGHIQLIFLIQAEIKDISQISRNKMLSLHIQGKIEIN